MQHSVWDWDQVRYDYYESPQVASIGGWNPLTGLGIPTKVNKSGSPIGLDIEAALPVLPRDAVYKGSGVQAIGQICRRQPVAVGDITDAPAALATKVEAALPVDFDKDEIAAFIGGVALGSFVAGQKSVSTLVLAVSALFIGLSANKNVVAWAAQQAKKD